ncbi:GIY-YIG nuclease family protein [Arthrobacter sp. zg-Y859]|uniref:GIY-YIG nuclease family protein n=1 Tax=Arthrobacter jinronghuae TaxID=2964609 RepID=A0ABT1NT68_9MICC|nr:GIY-YIG nuclease family protein [Arthrobacter jinronghuae]MCQ1950791.1 GIY-YIG nuclease family protein [Arthrobacter jinronghuae]UWX79260.1 GIY-YIG nuclease family protein [Arthrobacter jinronghuae]
MKSRPQTIQIFLPQGDPSGLRQAEITTRTVRVFEVPRAQVSAFMQMPEANQVGLYFLFGAQDEDTPECYIGQSGNVGRRLSQHVAGKEFWERALIAVSLTNSWTDTHVGFMEWKSIQAATNSGRYALLNGNTASNRHTPLPLESDCHEYLETISVLLATLGKPVLQPLTGAHPPFTQPGFQTDTGLPATPESQSNGTDHRLSLRQRNCVAEGVLSSEGLVVLAGSTGNAADRPSISAGLKRIRERLIEQGIARVEGSSFVMERDHLFSSPSYAAGALYGGAQNGRTAWKDALGRTLREIEEQQFPASGNATE